MLSVCRPISENPVQLDESAIAAIDELNDAMTACQVKIFVGGLQNPNEAKVVTATSPADETVTDGSLLSSTVYLNGFWVLEVESEAEALDWALRASHACRASIEIRAFH
jgi:hypothetical protein